MNDYFDIDMYYGQFKVSVKSSYFRIKSRPSFIVYGTLTYYDNVYHEEKVVSVDSDYTRVYDGIYDCIVNGKEQVIQHWQTLLQMEMLETGVKHLK